jgi:hypothetical protein
MNNSSTTEVKRVYAPQGFALERHMTADPEDERLSVHRAAVVCKTCHLEGGVGYDRDRRIAEANAVADFNASGGVCTFCSSVQIADPAVAG